MSINNDILGGSYTLEEVETLYKMNKREKGTVKPQNALYQKSMGEIAPTWAERR